MENSRLSFILIFVSQLMAYSIIIAEKMHMDSTVIVAIIGLAGIIISDVAHRFSNVSKLRKEIEKMANQLGLNDDKSLRTEVKDMFNSLDEAVGRRGSASLTEQHGQINQTIEKNFGVIQKRYETEDVAYRNFTMQQHDLKQTMDNFVRDYSESINNEHKLREANIRLEQENDMLREANTNLITENIKLKNQINHITKENDMGDMSR